MRYAQLVVGPAGSGKSTYCANLVNHAKDARRVIHVVNLDPAAEKFEYEPTADIRELIGLEDVMEDNEMHWGPNGGLVFCLEYLVLHGMDWLKEQLGVDEDDYVLFDCPGQIELYTHMRVVSDLLNGLQSWDFRVCAVFLLDSQFMVEMSKFFSGALAALSVMVNLEIPHVNVLSKIDLLCKKSKLKIERFLEADTSMLSEEDGKEWPWSKKYESLSHCIAKVLDDYSLVKFFPLDISDEDSFSELLAVIDNAIQYGEDCDVRVRDFDTEQDEAFYDS